MVTKTVAIVSGTTSRSFGRARRSIVPLGKWNRRSIRRGASRSSRRANNLASFDPMPGKLVSAANSGSSSEGRIALRLRRVGQPAGAREHRARPHDPLAVDHEERIGEGEAAADLLHVDMRLDPVADFCGAGEIGGQAWRD